MLCPLALAQCFLHPSIVSVLTTTKIALQVGGRVGRLCMYLDPKNHVIIIQGTGSIFKNRVDVGSYSLKEESAGITVFR